MVLIDPGGDDQVLRRIYAAAFAEEGWSQALEGVADHLGASSAALFTAASAAGEPSVHVFNHSTQMGAEFIGQWRTCDEWAAAAQRLSVRPCQVVSSAQLVPRQHLLRSPIYDGFLKRHEMSRMIGTLLSAGDRPDGLPYGHICWYRSDRARDFDAHEVDQLQRLVPHLHASVRLRHRMSWLTRRKGDQALEFMHVAAFVLDATGVIRHCNNAAQTFLTLTHGTVRGGRLRSVGARSAPALDVALMTCGPTNPVRLTAFVDEPLRQVVACTLVALHDQVEWEAFRGNFLLLIELPRRDGRRVAEALGPLFELTPAETRVLGELLAGSAPAEIAAACNSSVATVRTQMSSIFSKTGTRGQTDLLLLLRGMRF